MMNGSTNLENAAKNLSRPNVALMVEAEAMVATDMVVVDVAVAAGEVVSTTMVDEADGIMAAAEEAKTKMGIIIIMNEM